MVNRGPSTRLPSGETNWTWMINGSPVGMRRVSSRSKRRVRFLPIIGNSAPLPRSCSPAAVVGGGGGLRYGNAFGGHFARPNAAELRLRARQVVAGHDTTSPPPPVRHGAHGRERGPIWAAGDDQGTTRNAPEENRAPAWPSEIQIYPDSTLRACRTPHCLLKAG